MWQRWKQHAGSRPDAEAIIHWVAGEKPVRWTFRALFDTAVKFAVHLNNNGIGRNAVCAIIIRHNPYFYPLYMGISSLGAIPAVLAYPNPRLHPDKFRQGIESMSQRSGLDWILTEEDLAPVVAPLAERKESTIRGLMFPLNWDLEAADAGSFIPAEGIRDTDPFLLQHSSGTTGLQKPVLLSHRAVLEHVEHYARSIGQTEQDKVVSWLPLYHDMGLIAAFHLPLAYGIPSVQIDPFEWVLAPLLLAEAISKEQATLCWLPNFAYNMMADKIFDEDLEPFSLASMRMFINCSEPVRSESHRRFVEKFLPFGLDRGSLSACYAMAETTFAVTQTPAGLAPAEVMLDRGEIMKGKAVRTDNPEAARICVSSGTVIGGCGVRIVDGERRDLPAGQLGEVAIRSVSLFDGYRNYPEKTAAVMQDGWYFSGDIGFELDGEYYIVGRKKDIIISAGKNIYPEDIEDTVGAVPGVIPGRVIAMGEEDGEAGTELISVVAETATEDEAGRKKLKMEIVKAAMETDTTVSRVYLVPPRWLIKSSAGKPSRNACRERLADVTDKNKWRVR